MDYRLTKQCSIENHLSHLRQLRANSLHDLMEIKNTISCQILELIDLLRDREHYLNQKINQLCTQQNNYYTALLHKCFTQMYSEEYTFEQSCLPQPIIKYEAELFELKQNIKLFGKISMPYVTVKDALQKIELEEDKEIFSEHEARIDSYIQNLTKTASLDSFEVLEKVEMCAEDIENSKYSQQDIFCKAFYPPKSAISVKESLNISDWIYKSCNEECGRINIPKSIELTDIKVANCVNEYPKKSTDFTWFNNSNIPEHLAVENSIKPNIESIDTANTLNPNCDDDSEKIIKNAFSSYFKKDYKMWLCSSS